MIFSITCLIKRPRYIIHDYDASNAITMYTFSSILLSIMLIIACFEYIIVNNTGDLLTVPTLCDLLIPTFPTLNSTFKMQLYGRMKIYVQRRKLCVRLLELHRRRNRKSMGMVVIYTHLRIVIKIVLFNILMLNIN